MSDLERCLEPLLTELVSRPDIHHAVMAVERGDGAFRWAGAAGDADEAGTPMRAETPFFIASIDKLFTAAVVLKLRERGLVRLEDPIGAYLPQEFASGLHRIGGVDYTAAISIGHLLGHTSGLASYLEDAPRGERSLVERLVLEGDRLLPLERALADVRDRLAPHFPPQPPGSRQQKARYSDTNYRLLIMVIEKATGHRVHRAFEEMIIGPLNLRQTWLPGWGEPLDPAPPPAELWFGSQVVRIPLALASLPSVFSTTADLLAFLKALVRGTIFDRDETAALMQSRWNRFGLPLDRAALRAPSWPIAYGLGMMRFQLPRIFTGFRPLPPVVGHSGSTGSWLFYCPALDLLLAGTVDQGSAGAVPYRIVPRILRAWISRA